MRNVSLEQFRSFIRVSEEWDGLPLADSLYRLYLLADYFAEQTGIRFSTYVGEAWRIRFHDNAWNLSESSFLRAMKRARKEARITYVPGEVVYDQFLASCSNAVPRRASVPRSESRPDVRTKNGPLPRGTLDDFFTTSFGDHLKNFSLER